MGQAATGKVMLTGGCHTNQSVLVFLECPSTSMEQSQQCVMRDWPLLGESQRPPQFETWVAGFAPAAPSLFLYVQLLWHLWLQIHELQLATELQVRVVGSAPRICSCYVMGKSVVHPHPGCSSLLWTDTSIAFYSNVFSSIAKHGIVSTFPGLLPLKSNC